VYALKLAKNIAELKAVSQNLMHSNISTTDGIYGILSETDIREQISSLGKIANSSKEDRLEELANLAKSILETIENRRQ